MTEVQVTIWVWFLVNACCNMMIPSRCNRGRSLTKAVDHQAMCIDIAPRDKFR